MIVSAWAFSPGLQLPAWGNSKQPFSLYLENNGYDTWMRLSLKFIDHGLYVEHLSGLLFPLDLIYPSFP